MKVRSAIKLRCNSCTAIRRGKTVYIVCLNGKHHQRQG